ncbi:MAG: hypothetical protein IH825_05145 [Candidatus Marinimicrobia bacterium]|nr:hypothetical protein [Candidatus Neomarinimicrobiota bacterium]
MKTMTLMMVIAISITFASCASFCPMCQLKKDPGLTELRAHFDDFLQNEYPQKLKNLSSAQDAHYILGKGVSAPLDDITAMRDNAFANARRRLASSIQTDVTDFSQMYSRTFVDFGLSEDRSKQLGETLGEQFVDQALKFNIVLLERDFRRIGEGYWAVIYVSKADMDRAAAELALIFSEYISEEQRDSFKSKMEKIKQEALRKREEEKRKYER